MDFAKRSLLAVCLLVTTTLFTTTLFAQFDTSEVLGTVRDPSGSPVPRATVTLSNQDTGVEVKTSTNDAGEYDFFNARVGRYTVTVEATGFSKATATDIQVNVGARQRVDLTMQV